MKLPLTTITCYAAAFTSSQAAMVVIDSFNQDPVDLSITRSHQSEQNDIGDLKTSRYIGMITAARGAALGSIVTVTIDPSEPGFSFFVDGLPALPQNIIDVNVLYGRGKLVLLAGYEAFEFEILSLSGSGNLLVDTGRVGPTGPDVNVIVIQGPGVIRVPFSEMNFDPNLPDLIGFTFQATSKEFSVNLGEFRAVPEPSSAILLATALLAITVRRRRI